MSNNSDNTIIVPVNVQAICIGQEDAKKPYFIKRNADFSLLPYRDGNNTYNPYANISEHILNEPFDSDRHALPQGIHLHWALPDAFTHAIINNTISKKALIDHFKDNGEEIWATLTTKQWLIPVEETEAYFNDLSLLSQANQNLGELEGQRSEIVSFLDRQQMKFQNVPNRWLITRIVNDEYSKSWVVESDLLSSEDYVDGVKKLNVTVPYISDKSPKPYRYLGEDFNYSNWSPDNEEAEEYYPNLTAIGYGDMEFAGYYPNCNSVFGFHDDLSGVNDESAITYQVTGWYSNLNSGSTDPFKRSSNTKELLDKFGWALNDDVQIEKSLYSGTVASVNWNSSINYIQNGDEPYDVKTSFAIKEEEALSTLATDSHYQLFLTAWQMGIESQLDSPDGLIKVEKSSHSNRFQKIEGGFLWDVIDQETTNDPTSPKNVKELPTGIVEALAKINPKQEEYNRLSSSIISMRERVFSDWCKYLVQKYDSTYFQSGSSPSEKEVEISAATIRAFIENTDLKELDTLLASFNQVSSDIESKFIPGLTRAIETANAGLNKKYTVSHTPAPSYYQGNDPVILFEDTNGEGWQYAGSRNHINAIPEPDKSTVALPCRVSTEILKSSQANLVLPNKENFPLHDVLNELINEGYILRNGSSMASHDSGTPPSPIAVVTYPKNENPWLVMQLHWKVYFSGLRKGSEGYDNSYISDAFTLTSDSTELKANQNVLAYASSFGAEQTLKGKCILTPHVNENAKNQIDRSIEQYSNSEELTSRLQHIKDKLEEAKDSTLAQALTGFNDALVMNQQSLQVQVDDPLAAGFDRPFANEIRNAVAEENTSSPLPLNQYYPIHTGLIRVEEMRLVDCFGRYQKMNVENVDYSKDLELDTPIVNYTAMLPPRITQPSRVLFEYLNADSKESLPEMIRYSGQNPVCGWVMLNILENAFMIYNGDGTALGSLRVALDADSSSPIIWQTAPGRTTPSIDDALASANEYLAKFVKGIKSKDADYFQSFIKSIKESQKWINRNSYKQDLGMGPLIGEPIALVRASIDLQLQGLPEMDESWNALKNDMQNPQEERSIASFTNVTFPAQVGTFDRQGDGLYGFFKEDKEDDSKTFKTYYTAPDITQSGISENTQVQLAATEGDITTLYMLVTPSNPVHLNMGILPEQKVEIPLKYCEDAMNKISTTFLSGPLLINADDLRVPLSKQRGMEWSFIEKNADDSWSNTKDNPEKDILDASNDATYTTSQRKIIEGWLQLSKEND